MATDPISSPEGTFESGYTEVDRGALGRYRHLLALWCGFMFTLLIANTPLSSTISTLREGEKIMKDKLYSVFCLAHTRLHGPGQYKRGERHDRVNEAGLPKSLLCVFGLSRKTTSFQVKRYRSSTEKIVRLHRVDVYRAQVEGDLYAFTVQSPVWGTLPA